MDLDPPSFCSDLAVTPDLVPSQRTQGTLLRAKARGSACRKPVLHSPPHKCRQTLREAGDLLNITQLAMRRARPASKVYMIPELSQEERSGSSPAR